MSVRANKSVTLMGPADIDGDTLEGFYAELEDRLRDSPGELVLDCSLLEHTASSHINTLWQARNRCDEAGVMVKLTSVTYGLERVLKVLDLYDFFAAERDGVEARAGLPGLKVDMAAPPVFEIELEATPEGIGQAMEDFHAFLMELNLGEIPAFDMETVFYEVTTNIRLHGQLGAGESISFRASPQAGVFRLRFEDSGPRFDPTSDRTEFDPRKAMKSRQRQGFGLAIIRRLVDRISYDRHDQRLNVLNIDKRIGDNGGRHS